MLSHAFHKKGIVPSDEQYKLFGPIRVTRVDFDIPPSRIAASSSARSLTSIDDLMTELRTIRSEMQDGFKNLNARMDHFERSSTPYPPFQ